MYIIYNFLVLTPIAIPNKRLGCDKGSHEMQHAGTYQAMTARRFFVSLKFGAR